MKSKTLKALLLAVPLAMTLSVTAAAATDYYRVQPGDTLWKIAMKYQITVYDLINANPQLRDANVIYINQVITVPVPSGRQSSPASGSARQPETSGGLPGAENSITDQVVALCNKERAVRGLKAFVSSSELAKVANIKSNDMRANNYFSHTSSTYGSPFEMLNKFGVTYKSAGENIAKGQKTAEAVVKAWMNSEGHRSNILSPSFTQIGVGFASGNGTTYWTQLFILK
ncbi:MAG: CAP domain-containing protein [Clostridiales bacterium]|jgi:uncharacterized YkwD family protein|nr:CAP domain-containing protein [Clostridiales bacterium]